MKPSFWKECDCTKFCITKESKIEKRCKVKGCEVDCDSMNGVIVEVDPREVEKIECDVCAGTGLEDGLWCFACVGRGYNYDFKKYQQQRSL